MTAPMLLGNPSDLGWPPARQMAKTSAGSIMTEIPYSRLFSRGKIFANFTNRAQFVKILSLKCFFSVGTLHNL